MILLYTLHSVITTVHSTLRSPCMIPPDTLSSNSPLLPFSTSSETEAAPFSLKGLREFLLRPLIKYEKFANCNGNAIEALESALRSISYVLPGRFKDSEFVSEICNRNSFDC